MGFEGGDGPRAFHVHEKGELGNNCKDAGGHYNPTNVSATLYDPIQSILI